MSDSKKILGGVLALVVIVGLYAIAMFYVSDDDGSGQNISRKRAVRNEQSMASVSASAIQPVPETPDAVAEDILSQASVDETALDDESESINSLLEEDRSSIDNLGNIYEEAEL